METELMSIGELAARSGLSPKALRLYAESGLLSRAAWTRSPATAPTAPTRSNGHG